MATRLQHSVARENLRILLRESTTRSGAVVMTAEQWEHALYLAAVAKKPSAADKKPKRK